MSLDGAKLICLDDSGARQEVIEAKGRTFTIGYYANCDFYLEDARARGVHCEIQSDAFGRISIYNKSEEYPVQIDDHTVQVKRPLLNGTNITILGKKFLWEFPKTVSSVFEEISSEQVSTPQKQLGIPEQPPNSCPDLKFHREIHKRFTVHNFAYSIKSTDESQIKESEENKNMSTSQQETSTTNKIETAQDLEQQMDCKFSASPSAERCVTPEPNVNATLENMLEETPKMNLINCTQNKENASTEKKQKLLSFCKQSDIVITSFSPRETGVRMEKSFTAIYNPTAVASAVTPKSVYSTPKSILGEMNDDASRDLMDFSTPATSKKAHTHIGSTSMHLIDFTTPSVLRPASPYRKPILKSTNKKELAQIEEQSCSSTGKPVIKHFSDISEKQLGVSALPATPKIPCDESNSDSQTPSSIGSAISVDSTDLSSLIEISGDDSSPETAATTQMLIKTPNKKGNIIKTGTAATTPMRTPQSLMKRAIITSAKKVHATMTPKTTGTKTTVARNLSDSARRGSLSTPVQKFGMGSVGKSQLIGSPAVASTSAAAIKRSSLSASKARTSLLSSTPLARSTSKLRNTDHLHGVRKSFGGTPLASHISKARKSILVTKRISPPSVSAQLVSKARKSLCVTPASARARRLVAAAAPAVGILKEAPSANKTVGANSRSVLFADTSMTENNELSRTFIVDSDEECEDENLKSSSKLKDATYSPLKEDDIKTEPLDKTFSPEKPTVADTIEIPIDAAEVKTIIIAELKTDEDKVTSETEETMSKECEPGSPAVSVISENFAEVLKETVQEESPCNDEIDSKEKDFSDENEVCEIIDDSITEEEVASTEEINKEVIDVKNENQIYELNDESIAEDSQMKDTPKIMEQVTEKCENDMKVSTEKVESELTQAINTTETPIASPIITILQYEEKNDVINGKNTELDSYSPPISKNDKASLEAVNDADKPAISSDEIYVKPIGESEDTAFLLKEIDYVLNKSDELQKHIKESEATEVEKSTNEMEVATVKLTDQEQIKENKDVAEEVAKKPAEKTKLKENIEPTEKSGVVEDEKKAVEIETETIESATVIEDDEKENQLQEPASPQSPNLRGLREMLKTPKIAMEAKTPRLAGLRTLLRTPKTDAKHDNLEGVEALLKTPIIHENIEMVRVSCTPKRVTRRSSMSADVVSAPLTPKRITRRRQSMDEVTTPLTPKRITRRRPSMDEVTTPQKTSAVKRNTLFEDAIPEDMGAIMEEEVNVIEATTESESHTTTTHKVELTAENSSEFEEKENPVDNLTILKENVISSHENDDIFIEENICEEVISGSEEAPHDVQDVEEDETNVPAIESKDDNVELTEDNEIETMPPASHESVAEILDESDYEYGKEVQEVKGAVNENNTHVKPVGKNVAIEDEGILMTPNMRGMREMLKTPKITAKTPKFLGLRDMMRTPKVTDGTQVQDDVALVGLEELVKTPKLERTKIAEECAESKSSGIVTMKQSPKTPKNAMQKTAIDTPVLSKVAEMRKTDEEIATANLKGLTELVKTPQREMKRELLEEPPCTSTEAKDTETFYGMRKMLKTPKSCSTPHMKGIREMMQTPRVCSTPYLAGIKELLDTSKMENSFAEVTAASAITEQAIKIENASVLNETQDEGLDKFFRTPRAKNLMIPGLPPSAVIEKSSDSVELVHSTEYELNSTNTEHLEDIFKTPVTSTRFAEPLEAQADDEDDEAAVEKVENVTNASVADDSDVVEVSVVENKTIQIEITDTEEESRNLSAEEAFDALVGESLPMHTPARKVYTHKTLSTPAAQQSPFSSTDIITDLPKTDIQEWVDSLEDEPDVTNVDDFEENIGLIDEKEVTLEPANDHELSRDPLTASTAKNISTANVQSCAKVFFKDDASATTTSDMMANVSTLSSAIDPLSSSVLQKTETQPVEDTVTVRSNTPIQSDISGIHLLDDTAESECFEALAVSDSDSLSGIVVQSLNNAEENENANQENVNVTVSEDDFIETLIVSDTESVDEMQPAAENNIENKTSEIIYNEGEISNKAHENADTTIQGEVIVNVETSDKDQEKTAVENQQNICETTEIKLSTSGDEHITTAVSDFIEINDDESNDQVQKRDNINLKENNSTVEIIDESFEMNLPTVDKKIDQEIVQDGNVIEENLIKQHETDEAPKESQETKSAEGDNEAVVVIDESFEVKVVSTVGNDHVEEELFENLAKDDETFDKEVEESSDNNVGIEIESLESEMLAAENGHISQTEKKVIEDENIIEENNIQLDNGDVQFDKQEIIDNLPEECAEKDFTIQIVDENLEVQQSNKEIAETSDETVATEKKLPTTELTTHEDLESEETITDVIDKVEENLLNENIVEALNKNDVVKTLLEVEESADENVEINSATTDSIAIITHAESKEASLQQDNISAVSDKQQVEESVEACRHETESAKDSKSVEIELPIAETATSEATENYIDETSTKPESIEDNENEIIAEPAGGEINTTIEETLNKQQEDTNDLLIDHSEVKKYIDNITKTESKTIDVQITVKNSDTKKNDNVQIDSIIENSNGNEAEIQSNQVSDLTVEQTENNIPEDTNDQSTKDKDQTHISEMSEETIVVIGIDSDNISEEAAETHNDVITANVAEEINENSQEPKSITTVVAQQIPDGKNIEEKTTIVVTEDETNRIEANRPITTLSVEESKSIAIVVTEEIAVCENVEEKTTVDEGESNTADFKQVGVHLVAEENAVEINAEEKAGNGVGSSEEQETTTITTVDGNAIPNDSINNEAHMGTIESKNSHEISTPEVETNMEVAELIKENVELKSHTKQRKRKGSQSSQSSEKNDELPKRRGGRRKVDKQAIEEALSSVSEQQAEANMTKLTESESNEGENSEAKEKEAVSNAETIEKESVETTTVESNAITSDSIQNEAHMGAIESKNSHEIKPEVEVVELIKENVEMKSRTKQRNRKGSQSSQSSEKNDELPKRRGGRRKVDKQDIEEALPSVSEQPAEANMIKLTESESKEGENIEAKEKDAVNNEQILEKESVKATTINCRGSQSSQVSAKDDDLLKSKAADTIEEDLRETPVETTNLERENMEKIPCQTAEMTAKEKTDDKIEEIAEESSTKVPTSSTTSNDTETTTKRRVGRRKAEIISKNEENPAEIAAEGNQIENFESIPKEGLTEKPTQNADGIIEQPSIEIIQANEKTASVREVDPEYDHLLDNEEKVPKCRGGLRKVEKPIEVFTESSEKRIKTAEAIESIANENIEIPTDEKKEVNSADEVISETTTETTAMPALHKATYLVELSKADDSQKVLAKRNTRKGSQSSQCSTNETEVPKRRGVQRKIEATPEEVGENGNDNMVAQETNEEVALPEKIDNVNKKQSDELETHSRKRGHNKKTTVSVENPKKRRGRRKHSEVEEEIDKNPEAPANVEVTEEPQILPTSTDIAESAPKIQREELEATEKVTVENTEVATKIEPKHEIEPEKEEEKSVPSKRKVTSRKRKEQTEISEPSQGVAEEIQSADTAEIIEHNDKQQEDIKNAEQQPLVSKRSRRQRHDEIVPTVRAKEDETSKKPVKRRERKNTKEEHSTGINEKQTYETVDEISTEKLETKDVANPNDDKLQEVEDAEAQPTTTSKRNRKPVENVAEGHHEIIELDERHLKSRGHKTEVEHSEEITNKQTIEEVEQILPEILIIVEDEKQIKPTTKRRARKPKEVQHDGEDEVELKPKRRAGGRKKQEVEEEKDDEKIIKVENKPEDKKSPSNEIDTIQVASETSEEIVMKKLKTKLEVAVSGSLVGTPKRGGRGRRKAVEKPDVTKPAPPEVEEQKISNNELVPPVQKKASRARKGKESNTEHESQDERPNDESAKKEKAIKTPAEIIQQIAATPRRTRKASVIDVDAHETAVTPQSQRIRSVPRRAAAAQEHNYDESSDTENDFKRIVKKSPSQAKVLTDDAEVAMVTSRGRKRKPTAKVQQLLEEERAKADTPKRRLLLASAASVNSPTPQKMPAKRGRKASTIETSEVLGTPQMSKGVRGRNIHVLESSEQSHSEVEHTAEAEVEAEETGSSKVDAIPAAATTKARGGRRGVRKAIATMEQVHDEDVKEEKPKSATRGGRRGKTSSKTQPLKKELQTRRHRTASTSTADDSADDAHANEEAEEENAPLSQIVEKTGSIAKKATNKRVAATRKPAAAAATTDSPSPPKRRRRKVSPDGGEDGGESKGTNSPAVQQQTGHGSRKVVRFEKAEENAAAATSSTATSTLATDDVALVTEATTAASTTTTTTTKRATRTRRLNCIYPNYSN